MRRMIMTLLLAGVAGACSYGMKARDFVPASGPRGVIGHVSLNAAQFDAELIEVRDTGVIVLTNSNGVPSASVNAANRPRLRLLPYVSIHSVRFDQTNLRVGGGVAPAAGTLRRLRLLSRFPPGVPPDLLDTLLRAYGQTELDGANP